MKNVLICIAIISICFLISNPVFAAKGSAVEKGSIMGTGSFSLTNSSGDLYESNGNTLTSITLTSGIGFFVTDGLSIGASLNLIYLVQDDNNYTLIGLGPELTYYFNTNSSTYPFLGIAYSYSKKSNGNDVSLSSIILNGGALFMINEFVGISGKLQYSINSQTRESYGEDQTADGSILGIYFGFNMFFQ